MKWCLGGVGREVGPTKNLWAKTINRLTETPVRPAQPRAEGETRLTVKRRGGRTVLDRFRQSGSMKCLFPRVHGQNLQAVLVNTGGGVTGGDRFDTFVHARSETDLILTTQACERAYRALPGLEGRIRTRLRVGKRARLVWVPQETLLFDGSALDRRLSVELAEDASFLMVEPLIFGRTEMGETLHSARFSDRIDIRRGGVPLYLDALHLAGDVEEHLSRPFVAGGAHAMASLVLVSERAEAHLEPLRQMLPSTGGVSLLRPDVLVLRLLAQDSFDLRRTLIPILTRLSGSSLPRCWMI